MGTVGAMPREAWKNTWSVGPWGPHTSLSLESGPAQCQGAHRHIRQEAQLRRAEPETGLLMEDSKSTFVTEPRGQWAWGDLLLAPGDPP